MNKIIYDDNLIVLRKMESESVDLIYIDPPFNTGKRQEMNRIKTVRDEENGDRTGFQGKRYRTIPVSTTGYDDSFEDYPGFLEPRLIEALRILKPNGSLFVHLDLREVHYIKVVLDQIFGRESFINEIIWHWDYGGKSKKTWPLKHNNILWYAKNPENYTYNWDKIDWIPYQAKGLVSEEKLARGKKPTDTWFHSIVGTNSKERTGYKTQKPLGVVGRIVKVHSNSGDLLLDFFAGSGTFGEAAAKSGRNFILVDNNPEAIEVMAKRLHIYDPDFVNCEDIAAETIDQEPPRLF